MALTIGRDEDGPFVVIECDTPDCGSHEAGRPYDAFAQGPLEIVALVADAAIEDGWLLSGAALCPGHVLPWLAASGVVLVESRQDGLESPLGAAQPVKPRDTHSSEQRGLTGVH